MKKAKRLKKATLAEIAKLLTNKEKTTGSTKWGVVKAVNTDAVTGKTTYNVQLDGASEQVQCAKLSGAKVGDVVAVNITATGSAVVAGTKNGDTDAADAQTTANNAYSKAAGIENHFWYDSNGAHVSTDTTIGTNTLNTLINSGGMAIRKGTTELSKFTDNLIELGKNSDSAVIKMCGDLGRIIAAEDIYGISIMGDSDSLSAIDIGGTSSYDTIILNAGASAGIIPYPSAIIELYAEKAQSGDSSIGLNADTIRIKNNILADFVIAQGTSNNWNYRKWYSGKCELWRTYTGNFAINTSGSGGYTTATARTLTLPFSVSNAVCTATDATGSNNLVATASGKTFTYRPYRMNSVDAADRTFNFRIDATY